LWRLQGGRRLDLIRREGAGDIGRGQIGVGSVREVVMQWGTGVSRVRLAVNGSGTSFFFLLEFWDCYGSGMVM